MLDLTKIKKKIKHNNLDIIYYYKAILYLSNSKILKIKIGRLIFLFYLFVEKYIFKKNISNKKNSIPNKIPIKNESYFDKKNLSKTLEKLISKDVIIIDIYDVLLNKNIDFKYINDFKKIDNLFDVNTYGINIFKVLNQNNKEIVLLLQDEVISINQVRKYLEEKALINGFKIMCYNSEKKEFYQYINDLIEKYENDITFGYVGKYNELRFKNKNVDFEVFMYESSDLIGKKFRPKDSFLKISIYNQVINKKMHGDHKKYDNFYEFGFNYGGILTYYIFTQMVINNNSFDVEYNKFLRYLCENYDFENNIFLKEIINLVFPEHINNFIYDNKRNSMPMTIDEYEIHNQKFIQQGIMEFCLEYEKKLANILNDNKIEIADIKTIIDFILENKNTAKRRWL